MTAWRLYSILSIVYYLLVILTVLALVGKTATPPWGGAGCNYESVFAQYVKHPTRQINILDVVSANGLFIIQTVEVEAPFANSDHCTILFTLQVADGTYSESTDAPYKRYIWDKAAFVGLSNYVEQVDWLGLMSVNLVPDDIWAA